MELQTISMNKETALAKLKQCREALQKEKSQELTQLARLYRAVAQGKRILDFYATMRAAGSAILNEDGDPKIGIARIGWKRVRFVKERGGIGKYQDADTSSWSGSHKFDVRLPRGTFPEWKLTQGQYPMVARANIETLVPMVPPQYRPNKPDSETLPYYILWEVEKWEPQAPRDPYLLRRVSVNCFIIEAQWNTTKLERAFINGRVRA